MKKFIIKFVAVTLLISIGIFLYFYQLNKSKQDKNYLTIYGNVDIRQVNLAFRVGGRISDVLVEEGDLIKPHQVIAVLDKQPYLDEKAVAMAQLETAEANYLKYKNGSRPQDIASAQANVKDKEAAYKNALKLYNRQNEVVDNGAIAKQDLDNTITQKKQAQEQLKTAKEQLDLAQEGFRYEDVKAAKAQVLTAKANIGTINTKLSDTRIVAPSEGIILTRIQEKGAIVAAGTPVYTLSLTKPVWIRTYVAEPDLGKIYPGMKADIYTDSRPNNPYKGEIGFISPVSEFTPKNVETTELRTNLVYRLRVIVPKPDKYLRQGMPVTVKLYLNNNSKH